MIDLADRLLLAETRHALSVPFRDPVRVSGVLVLRKLARAVERALSRYDLQVRRSHNADGSGAVVSLFHGSAQ